MIEIINLSKRYGKKTYALRDVHLTIGSGLYGLLGPNGAGKTTLMRILVTLLKPTFGQVTINGVSLAETPDLIRQQIGYLPQVFQIDPRMTGWEFLDYVGVMKGIPSREERTQCVKAILERVNLIDQASQKVKTYSGGMRQRLGIAQALLGDPPVLVVDEPTAGLDPEERVRFRNLLAELSADRIVILSTHIVADIEASCNELAVIDRGRVAMTGTLSELQRHAEGKVWDVVVEDDELALLQQHSQIVTTRRAEDGVRLRVISADNPLGKGTPVPPSLEDGYMTLLGEKSNA